MNVPPPIREEERELLRAVFVANESSKALPTIRALRAKMDRTARTTIDGLVDRGLVKIEGENYRLSLAGLYAADLDGARECISLFNAALPALQKLWKQEATHCAVEDVVRLMERTQPVVEHDLKRALWYVLPSAAGTAFGGWTSTPGVGEIVSFSLSEPVLDLEPLPLTETPSSESGAYDPAGVEEGEEMAVQKDPRNIFVVHGRNKDARDAVFDFLRAVGLNPMEFEEARRFTGKASPYVGEVLDAAFTHAQAIVVVMTGDDEARLRDQFREASEPAYEVNLTPQPRPNVLFEAGMALGRDPDRTLLIEIGSLRPFSDVAGRHTVRLRDGAAGERQSIVARLRDAGCAVVTEGRRDWLERPFFDKVLEVKEDVKEVEALEDVKEVKALRKWAHDKRAQHGMGTWFEVPKPEWSVALACRDHGLAEVKPLRGSSGEVLDMMASVL